MRKKGIIVSLLLVLTLMLTACGTQTLEDYCKDNKDFKSEIESSFSALGLGGKNVTTNIKDNNITLSINMASALKDISITDDIKESLTMSFDRSFNEQAGVIAKEISNIEEKSEVKEISVTIKINNDKEELYSKSFTSKSKSTETTKPTTKKVENTTKSE